LTPLPLAWLQAHRGRPLDACKVDRRVDQTDMAECLRKISKHAAGTRVVFLGEQTEIIRLPCRVIPL
jgi:hypothetical protein